MACSKIATKLETILECGICKDIVQKPKRLICFHSFCKTCINKQPKHKEGEDTGVLCPICKAFSEEKQVKSSIFVNELLDAYSVAQDEDYKCQSCAKNTAKWSCIECKMGLCDECKINHHKFPLMRNHRFREYSNTSDIIVDQLVFCETHPDEIKKFNCKTCNVLICMMCKVTNHESHQTETIQENIQRILPELQMNCSNLEDKVKTLDTDNIEILAKMDEVKTSCTKCRDKARNNLNQVIENAKAQHAEVTKEIDKIEEEELNKLKAAQLDAENKKKEYSHMCEWINTTTNMAQGVTLVAEVQAGYFVRVSDVAKPKYHKPVYVKTPELEGSITKEGLQGMIGNVKYNKVSIFSNKGIKSGKTPPMPFSQLFCNQLEKGNNIQLPTTARRMNLINGDIWVPIAGNDCIHIYDKDGNKVREIRHLQPNSVTQAENGDIIVASSTGLHVCDTEGNILYTIYVGTFGDVSVKGEKMYAIHYNTKYIYTCTYNHDKWSYTSQITKNNGRNFQIYDTISFYNENVYATSLNFNNNISQYDGNTCTSAPQHHPGLRHRNPYICGTDSDGNTLVSYYRDSVLQILNQSGEWQKLTLPPGSANIFDIISGDESNVWVLQYNTSGYSNILHYTYQ